MVGDVVHIPAGETHWHGATSNTVMAHTAISLGSKLAIVLCFRPPTDDGAETSWREEVPQAEYDKAHEVAE